jgi:hypothetical protein
VEADSPTSTQPGDPVVVRRTFRCSVRTYPLVGIRVHQMLTVQRNVRGPLSTIPPAVVEATPRIGVPPRRRHGCVHRRSRRPGGDWRSRGWRCWIPAGGPSVGRPGIGRKQVRRSRSGGGRHRHRIHHRRGCSGNRRMLLGPSGAGQVGPEIEGEPDDGRQHPEEGPGPGGKPPWRPAIPTAGILRQPIAHYRPEDLEHRVHNPLATAQVPHTSTLILPTLARRSTAARGGGRGPRGTSRRPGAGGNRPAPQQGLIRDVPRAPA